MTPFSPHPVESTPRVDLYTDLQKIPDIVYREKTTLDALYTHVPDLIFVTKDAIFLVQVKVQPSNVTKQLNQIVGELDRLKNRDLCYEDFRITNYAYRTAKFYLLETFAKMVTSFPTPSFVSDGEGGVIIKWQRGARIVRLSCRAEIGQQNYLYWEADNEYDIDENVTPSSLTRYLNWLNQG